MKQIFVSYSRQDEAFMNRLVQALESCGVAVWYDRKGIGAGADWIQELTNALDHLDLMLLILSPAALQSQWVETEWRTFIARGKPVLPIIYRPVSALPQELGRIQYFTFDAVNFAGSMNRLLDELRVQGFRPARDYVEPQSQPSSPAKKSKPVDWVKWSVLITLFIGLLTVAATVAQPYLAALLEQPNSPTMISPTPASQTNSLIVTDTVTPPPTAITPSTTAESRISVSEPGSITLLYEGEEGLTLLLPNPAQVQRIELSSTKGNLDVFELFDLASRIDLLAPNTCLRFVRNNSSTPLPHQCDVSSTIERSLAIVDVFWYDDARNLPLDLQIALYTLDATTITRVCPSSNPRCEISW